jgi:hypothetical protein
MVTFSVPTWAIEEASAVFGDGDGAIYAISASGNLTWQRHDGRMTGVATWANDGMAQTVGSGWAAPTKVFSGGDGVVYWILANGDLMWSRHNGRFTGVFDWATGACCGRRVSTGWGGFTKVFSGGDGVIYGVSADGRLWWRRHNGWLDGTNSWTTRTQVGSGWQVFSKVFSGDNGVIYGIKGDGALLWYRHNGRLTGANQWSNAGTGRVVGSGWQNVRQAFSSGDGIIYAAKQDGSLWWYRHRGWLNGNPSPTSATRAKKTRNPLIG